LVGSLYKQVVSRHPLGVPYGADKKIFAPYLSRELLHRLALNNACFDDWRRHNPDPNLKPPFGLIEAGIFSGGDEKAEPKSFHVERAQAGQDGSSRVNVRLAWESPPNKPLIWYVAVVVTPDNGRLAVNDILYLKNTSGEVESSLSDGLASQCIGARWVGGLSHPR
jgi:hypothetical protein